MAVGRYDDDMRDNQKLVNAGDRAAWLWWCGVMYCRRALSDGFIPTRQIPYLFRGAVNPRNSVAALVRERLWHEVQGGYLIHDYLDWNPTKAQVDAYRAKERVRKRGGKGGDSSTESIAESARIPDGFQTDSDLPSVTRAGARSSPLRSAGSGLDAENQDHCSSRASEPPAWRQGHRPTSALVGDHRRCCGVAAQACGRGICVPAFLVSQWRQQLGDDTLKADAAIRGVIAAELARHPEGPIGDDPLKLWRGAWLARHGSQLPASTSSRGHGTTPVDPSKYAGITEEG